MNTITLWLAGISGFLVNSVLPAAIIFVVGVLLIRMLMGFAA